MDYKNLDKKTREVMIEEILYDIQNNKLYISPRLSSVGIADYPQLLQEAAQNGDDTSMASQLSVNERLNLMESRRTSKGEIISAKIPSNAAETLASGEFNRFYIRALCRIAIDNGTQVIVYRARQSSNPRIESESKIGSSVDPTILLNDLRNNIGIDTFLHLPPGPNSGLSVHLP